MLTLVTLCFATLNAVWAFQAMAGPWSISANSFTMHINRSFFVPRTRIFVEIGLLVCFVTLWIRSKKSFVISVLALIGVELTYASWLARTYNGVKNAEALSYSTIQHHAYLGDA